jgi:hypothetical protein
MQRALDAFIESIARVENLAGLYKAIASLTTPAVDSSDILRAQIVLAVSALDFYIHEATLIGMLEVYTGKRLPTPAFERYRISVGAMMAGHTGGGTGWLEAEIRDRHSFLSFQQPDKIADAIRLFSEVKLWQEVAAKLSMDEEGVKSALRLIVDRRNKIAHEADLDPSYPGARWPISAADTAQSRQFLAELVEAIDAIVT